MSRTPTEVAIDERTIVAALHYLKGLTPGQLAATWSRAQPLVVAAEYPRLILVPSEGNDAAALQCPYCDRTLANADSEGIGVEVVDVAWRITAADSVRFEDREVTVWYDGSGDYEGLVYQCSECASAVRLPEGWREV